MNVTNVLMVINGMPGRWDEIIKKYGVRIGNGDKIGGILKFVDNEGFHIIGPGVGETGEVHVCIAAEDVLRFRIGQNDWIENVDGMEVVI